MDELEVVEHRVAGVAPTRDAGDYAHVAKSWRTRPSGATATSECLVARVGERATVHEEHVAAEMIGRDVVNVFDAGARAGDDYGSKAGRDDVPVVGSRRCHLLE